MIVIEEAEAQCRLHDMWQAILTDGEVQFAHNGLVFTSMRWVGSEETKQEVVQELVESIGFDASSLSSSGRR